jgi:hypothetical protein
MRIAPCGPVHATYLLDRSQHADTCSAYRIRMYVSAYASMPSSVCGMHYRRVRIHYICVRIHYICSAYRIRMSGRARPLIEARKTSRSCPISDTSSPPTTTASLSMSASTCVCKCVCKWPHTYLHIYIYIHACVCVCIYIYIYIHACIYIYIYTCIYISGLIHTCTKSSCCCCCSC